MCEQVPALSAEASAARLVGRGEVPELPGRLSKIINEAPGEWGRPYGYLPTYPAGEWDAASFVNQVLSGGTIGRAVTGRPMWWGEGGQSG